MFTRSRRLLPVALVLIAAAIPATACAGTPATVTVRVEGLNETL
jgi:hypothetical protein